MRMRGGEVYARDELVDTRVEESICRTKYRVDILLRMPLQVNQLKDKTSAVKYF